MLNTTSKILKSGWVTKTLTGVVAVGVVAGAGYWLYRKATSSAE